MSDKMLNYDYVITSPPDFIHLGLQPTDADSYGAFFSKFVCKLSNRCQACTIITTDRKHFGKIYTKHSIISRVFGDYGFDLVSQKIWIKSLGVVKNRLSYAFCLTFSRGIKLSKNTNGFLPDVFCIDQEIVDGYADNFPVGLVEIFLEEYTKPGEVVYDPFMGTASTAIAAIRCNREFIGSEIDLSMFNIGLLRIAQLNERRPAT